VAHPKSDDGRVLLALKGTVEGMGLLEGDEGLREGDMEELRRLWGDLRDLGSFAKRKGYVEIGHLDCIQFIHALWSHRGAALTPARVKLMIDAEHTWYQPALDAYTLLLSQEFNRPPRKPLGGVSSEWNGPLILYVEITSPVTGRGKRT
jgi:proline dehydrogenase